MDPRLTEYDEHYPQYVQVEQIVSDLITANLRSAHITPMQITHRVKTRESVAGKLVRKSEKYPTLDNMTDLIGFRIICYFSDQVDEIASFLRRLFVVDSKNSIDKRSAIPATAFGYISLHYICTLPRSGAYPEDLCNIPFEFQIKSVLQHTWAEISHDLGYKSEFGVPKKITREMSRVAGLLEIADDQFISIRDDIRKYGEEIERLLEQGKLNEVLIDLVTLKQYLEHNENITSFSNELIQMSGAKRRKFSPESYIEQLNFLGKKTIGDIELMLFENREKALKLARHTFETNKLNWISSNISLYFLCRAELLDNGYSLDDITKFMNLTTKDQRRAQRQAEHLVNMNFI